MGVADAFRAALGATDLVLRGPKPAQALKSLGLPPGRSAPAPTTDGVVEALRGVDLRGKTVGVQTFPEADPGLAEFVRSAGGEVREVLPYVYAADCPDGEVVGLIDALGRGEVDALAVTSSPQVARLFGVAEAHGKSGELAENLERTCVAAVGPVAERGLRERGVRVDVRPERGGFVMKRLVEHIKRHFADA
jgi:uroporphyrinogen-III synthase